MKLRKKNLIIFTFIFLSINSLNALTDDEKKFLEATDDKKENIDEVKKYIGNKGNLNVTDNQGNTALINAVQNLHVQTVKLLLEHGADAKIRNNKGETALMFITPRNIQIYLGAAPPKSEEENEKFEVLVGQKALEIFNLLLPVSDVNAQDNKGENALFKALWPSYHYDFDIEITKKLIELTHNVNTQTNKGETALMESKMPQYTKLLLAKGATVNIKDNKGKTPLMNAAAFKSFSENTKLIVDAGANINDVDKDGRNALMYASYLFSLRPETVKLLIEKGININAKDNKGKSVLDYFESAIKRAEKPLPNEIENIQILKNAGAK